MQQLFNCTIVFTTMANHQGAMIFTKLAFEKIYFIFIIFKINHFFSFRPIKQPLKVHNQHNNR